MVTEFYISAIEVARRLGISRRSLDRRIESGLPVRRIGPRLMRFDWAAVDAWVREQDEQHRRPSIEEKGSDARV